jgi:predicted RNase H-like HicB family nuclease
MFSEYIQAALARAEYVPIEKGDYCATVPGLRGVIATGETIEECRKDLIEVLEGWIALRLRLGMAIPPIGGKTIEVFAELEAVV